MKQQQAAASSTIVCTDRSIAMANGQSEWMTTTEAREYLGIAPATMSQILRDGLLRYTSSKLDKRYKMLRRAEVEEFARVNGIIPKNRPQRAA